MDQHELICALKALAIDLGRTPTRDEFSSHIKNGKDLVNKFFDNYSVFLIAAGFEPRNRRITNQIFEVPIEKHLQNLSPPMAKERAPYQSIACISDIHWPFSNQKVVDRFLEYVGDVKPQWVIINGDAWDMYSHSKFPRSHNVFTPREEQNLARKQNEEFWFEVHNRSQKSKKYQLLGNHDIRPMKRILEQYPEAEDWVQEKLTQLFTFKNVETIMDPRQELMIDDIAVFHGYRGKLGDHRDFTHYNTMNGHTHKGGVVFRKIRGQTLWELNSGLAGDPEAKGLTYTPQKITEWTPGFSAVDLLGPRFVSI